VGLGPKWDVCCLLFARFIRCLPSLFWDADPFTSPAVSPQISELRSRNSYHRSADQAVNLKAESGKQISLINLAGYRLQLVGQTPSVVECENVHRHPETRLAFDLEISRVSRPTHVFPVNSDWRSNIWHCDLSNIISYIARTDLGYSLSPDFNF